MSSASRPWDRPRQWAGVARCHAQLHRYCYKCHFVRPGLRLQSIHAHFGQRFCWRGGSDLLGTQRRPFAQPCAPQLRSSCSAPRRSRQRFGQWFNDFLSALDQRLLAGFVWHKVKASASLAALGGRLRRLRAARMAVSEDRLSARHSRRCRGLPHLSGWARRLPRPGRSRHDAGHVYLHHFQRFS